MKIIQMAERQDDNTKIQPTDLLKMALKEVETNKKIKAALVILYSPSDEDEKAGETDTFRCGLPWEREVAILSLQLKKTVERT